VVIEVVDNAAPTRISFIGFALAVLFTYSFCPAAAQAQDLKRRVASAPTAIPFATGDDLRRAGVTTLADSVALADGVHVARFNNGIWDEQDARELWQLRWRSTGAVVTSVDSARAALDEIGRRPPDGLLSDVGLPHEDGSRRMLPSRSILRNSHASWQACAANTRPRDDRCPALPLERAWRRSAPST
jgi:hypothetical protein